MWEKVGIVRHKSEMLDALEQLENYLKQIEVIKKQQGISRELLEVINLLDIAILITKSALNRPKSLGAHYLV